MAIADVRLIRILQALKVRTREGEVSWSPVATGFLHSGNTYTATIESDRPGGTGPFRLQIHGQSGAITGELAEGDEDPPGMDVDWRADLAALYALAGRENPQQEQLLEEVARELGIGFS